MTAKMNYIKFDFWSGDHRPYTDCIFTVNGDEVSDEKVLEDLLNEANVEDGDEFEITITKTNKRPFGEKRIIFQAAHTYSMETDKQLKERLKA